MCKRYYLIKLKKGKAIYFTIISKNSEGVTKLYENHRE